MLDRALATTDLLEKIRGFTEKDLAAVWSEFFRVLEARSSESTLGERMYIFYKICQACAPR